MLSELNPYSRQAKDEIKGIDRKGGVGRAYGHKLKRQYCRSMRKATRKKVLSPSLSILKYLFIYLLNDVGKVRREKLLVLGEHLLCARHRLGTDICPHFIDENIEA